MTLEQAAKEVIAAFDSYMGIDGAGCTFDEEEEARKETRMHDAIRNLDSALSSPDEARLAAETARCDICGKVWSDVHHGHVFQRVIPRKGGQL